MLNVTHQEAARDAGSVRPSIAYGHTYSFGIPMVGHGLMVSSK